MRGGRFCSRKPQSDLNTFQLVAMSRPREHNFLLSKAGMLKVMSLNRKTRAIVVPAGLLQQPQPWNLWLSLKVMIRNYIIIRYSSLLTAILRTSNAKVAGCSKLSSIPKLKESSLTQSTKDLTRQEQASAKIDCFRVILATGVKRNRTP